MDVYGTIENQARAALVAQKKLAFTSGDTRSSLIDAIKEGLINNWPELKRTNEGDLVPSSDLAQALIERLTLTEVRFQHLLTRCDAVSGLPDPLNQTKMSQRPNGLKVGQVTTPIGVIGVIAESRPEVFIECAISCIKSGNGLIFRGGSEVFRTNQIIAQIIEEATDNCGAIQFVNMTDREAAYRLMRLSEYIHALVVRGSKEFSTYVQKESDIPLIAYSEGVSHIFVDESADLEKVFEICENSTHGYMVAARNTVDTLLIHERIAPELLPDLVTSFVKAGYKIRGCNQSTNLDDRVQPAVPGDWATAHLDYIINTRVVSGFEAAVAHIETYGGTIAESIIAENQQRAEAFIEQIDAPAVFINAATTLTDGYEFGLGAELGISTQKLHCRGPIHPHALVSKRWLVIGNGHVRR